jgi:hypothetical protein
MIRDCTCRILHVKEVTDMNLIVQKSRFFKKSGLNWFSFYAHDKDSVADELNTSSEHWWTWENRITQNKKLCSVTLSVSAMRGRRLNAWRVYCVTRNYEQSLKTYSECNSSIFFPYGSTALRGPRPRHCTTLHDHTDRHTTFARTPLDEGPARRRDLYLTTHNTHKRQTSMPPWDSNPRS